MHAWVAASSTARQFWTAVATSLSMTEKALQVELANVTSSSCLQNIAGQAHTLVRFETQGVNTDLSRSELQ